MQCSSAIGSPFLRWNNLAQSSSARIVVTLTLTWHPAIKHSHPQWSLCGVQKHEQPRQVPQYSVACMQGSCRHALPLGSVSAHPTDFVGHLSASDSCGFHQHLLPYMLNQHTPVCMQGSCRHALSVPLGSISAHSADFVRYLSAADSGSIHQQHLAGLGGQLPVCAKLLVPE